MNRTVKFSVILGAMIVTCLALVPVTKADTTFVSGTIHFNTTWTPAGNPYMVVGDTRVDTNVVLTVEPGVVVKINPSISITIDGGLDARGTLSDSIIFTEKAGLWYRLTFSGSSMDSVCTLEYCRIEKCKRSIVFQGASPVISHCNISNNGCISDNYCDPALIIESGSSVRILNSTIASNQSRPDYGGAIDIQAGSLPEIRGNLIAGNYAYASGYGRSCWGGGMCVRSDSAIIIENIITDNSAYSVAATAGGGGIAVMDCSPLIACNEIMDNSAAGGGGIYIYDPTANPMIAGNTITGNSTTGGGVNAGAILCSHYAEGIFSLNNIHDNHDLVNSVFEVVAAQGTTPLLMENNWWGTTNSAEIDLLVYDFWDSPSLREIDFIPFSDGLNTPPADSIVVVLPNGGEEWQTSEVHNVRWNPFCFTDNVDIEYSTDGGSTWEVVAQNTRNFGLYPWEVPFAMSTTCRVRVFDAADSIPSDMSDNDFTICVGPTIQLTYPNGGEVLSADSSYDIMWNSYCFDSSVKIEYSTNGGADWTTIVADTANIGSIAWTAPDTTSLNCRVKVSDALDGDPFDISDDDFSVYICGDIDASGAVNVADLTYLVDYMFFEGPPPPVMEAANVDGEGGINVADLIYLVDYIFFEGPEPICGPIE